MHGTVQSTLKWSKHECESMHGHATYKLFKTSDEVGNKFSKAYQVILLVMPSII